MHFLSTLQKLLVPALFVVFYVLEPLYGARKIPKSRHKHLIENLKFFVMSVIILAAGASFIVSLAIGCEDIQFGLFHLIRHSKWNPLFILLGILVYDFVNYAVHLLYHKVDFLWTIHRLHHADPYIDVSSGFRLHPLECLFRVAIQITAVGILGIPAISLALYGVIVTICILWSHSNIEKQNKKWWFYLDKIIVMPDVHRLHHSVERKFHDRNFAIAFIIWDRLLGTYLAPEHAPKNFEIGLKGYSEDPGFLELLKDPILPFRH